MNGRLSSPETERALLAAIMTQPSHMTILDLVPELFATLGYRYIWLAMKSLYEAREPMSEVSVTARLRRQGRLEDVEVDGVWGEAGIHLLGLPAYNREAVEGYVRTLEDCFLRRRLSDTGKKLQLLALHDDREAGELVEEGNRELEALSRSDIKAQGDDLASAIARAYPVPDRGLHGLPGLRTGFPGLDEMTGGFCRQHLVHLGGRTGRGKTTVAWKWVLEVAKGGEPAAVRSLEMTREELSYRALACEGRVSHDAIRKGRLSYTERQTLDRVSEDLKKLPIVVTDYGGRSIKSICSWAKKLRPRPRIVVIDHLDLLENATDPRTIPEASAELKGLAKSLDATVIALRQLNSYSLGRGKDSAPAPTTEDLKYGGGPECDWVSILFKAKEEQEHLDLVLTKNRHANTGRIRLNPEWSYYRFSEG